MAHFAQILDGDVIDVIVVGNANCGGGDFPDSEAIGQAFIASCGIAGDFLQCSYSGSFRGAYPGPGWTYDSDLDEYLAPPIPEETP
jgi:hypothetical protein